MPNLLASPMPVGPVMVLAVNAANVDGFRHGLRELGYVDGEHFVIEYRSAEGRDEIVPVRITSG